MLETEMLIGFWRGHAAPGRPGHVALLDQEGFEHFFNGTAFFGQGGGNAFYTNRPSIEIFDNDFQQAPVHGIEALSINPQ